MPSSTQLGRRMPAYQSSGFDLENCLSSVSNGDFNQSSYKIEEDQKLNFILTFIESLRPEWTTWYSVSKGFI